MPIDSRLLLTWPVRGEHDTCEPSWDDEARRTPSTRTCANPGCEMPCPPGATIRRRFCSSACRQAAYRARRRCRHKIDVAEAVRTLDTELHTAIHELLRAVHESLERLPDRTCPRSTTTGELVELAQRVIDMAVARDRAAGVPWSEIGEGLGIRTTTARRRYGPRTAERLARFHDTEANTRPPRPRQ